MTRPDLGDETRGRCRPYQHLLDGLIATDPDAEQTVTGCAIARRQGALDALNRLDPADFHDPRCAAVILAAADTPDLHDGPGSWEAACRAGDYRLVIHGCARRAYAISQATDLPRSFMVQALNHRIVDQDSTGWFALRIRAAAHERTTVRQALDALTDRGVNVDALTRSPAAA